MLYPDKVKLVCPNITNSLRKLKLLGKNQLNYAAQDPWSREKQKY